MQLEIKNIVFDFGGVLLQIDYSKTFDALQALTGSDWRNESATLATTSEFMQRFEMGQISTETFINHIQRKSVTIPDARQVIDAWNAMLIGWNPDTFEQLTALRKQYKLFLLSNINPLHLEWIHKDLKKVHGIVDFETTFFDSVFYSHKIGMRKPNFDIYQFVQHQAKLIPAETIFIDDLAVNIQAAETAVGWHCMHHNPNKNVFDVLNTKLLTIERC